MSSWKKYFSAVPSQSRAVRSGTSRASENGHGGTSSKYSSYLPEVYSGAPNRVERYVQYEQMDLDTEINKALDVISDFSTQNFGKEDEPFTIVYKDNLTETEITLLKDSLAQWCALNKWQQRLWRAFRNVIKYGDQMYIRDPETFELIWVDPTKVEKIIVNENRGKDIEQYVIRDIDLNLQSLVATSMLAHDQYSFPGGYPRSSNPASGAGTVNYGVSTSPGSRSSRFNLPDNNYAIDGTHVVHLSLSEGMDNQWPFGTSILESIYKVYKQKDLLEDSIIIYRIVRAPERRIFYIDVGNLQGPRAMQYVERIKNEIYQRRIPNRNGGGQCLDLATKIPLLDGRILSLSDLITEFNNGKTNWVYSTDTSTGKIVPGLISWAGITRRNTQVIKLTLDNGETLIVTPDHKIPILGKGNIEAQHIEVNKDSLISFNTKFESINENNNMSDPQYHQIFDHQNNDWVFTHRMVANYFKDLNKHNELVYDLRFSEKNKGVIHHIDYNKNNNEPSNLAFMSGVDHFKLHANTYKLWWGSLSESQKAEYKQKNSNAVKEAYKNNPDYRTKLSNSIRSARLNDPTIIQRMSLSQLESWKRIKGDSEKYSKIRKQRSLSRKQHLKNNPGDKFQNQSNRFDNFMLIKCIDKVNLVGSNSKLICKELSNDCEFMNHYQSINQLQEKKISKLVFDKFTKDTLTKLVKSFGYSSWASFTASLGLGIQKSTLKISFDQRHISILVDMVKSNTKISKSSLPVLLNKNNEFLELLITCNQSKRGNAKVTKITASTVQTMLTTFGYNGWNDFKNKAMQYNHKVVSIEWLENTMDTGTITVDGNEIYHSHHNFATDSGVFVCNSVLDAAYSPIAINEDFFLAQNAEGKGSRIETLPGGENLGQIDDLKYFNNKMIRGLGIPSSYLPTGPDDGTAVFSDGKVGTAFVQEYRFTKYCQRLQNLMAPIFDKEFKLFLKHRGIEIQSNLFDLQFWEPQSFSDYRKIQKDSEHINLFTSIMGSDAGKYISKRYALVRYLGWTEEDVLENEKKFQEENADKVKAKTGKAPSDTGGGVGLENVGIRDIGGPGEDMALPGEEGAELGGAAGAAPGREELGGAAPPPPPPGGGL